MKQMLFSAAFIAVSLVAVFAQGNAPNGGGHAEVSFTFTRQSGFASNQFAVWVEDAGGKLVKTLYATRFTAAGGFKKRPSSIPLWVKQASLEKLGKQEVDALTGATPKTGGLVYVWDGTNQAGAAVPAGEYRVFLEATLRNDDRVLYSAAVRIGGAGSAGTADGKALTDAPAQAQYFGKDSPERKMISNVRVSYR
jgi:hypothetical protein